MVWIKSNSRSYFIFYGFFAHRKRRGGCLPACLLFFFAFSGFAKIYLVNVATFNLLNIMVLNSRPNLANSLKPNRIYYIHILVYLISDLLEWTKYVFMIIQKITERLSIENVAYKHNPMINSALSNFLRQNSFKLYLSNINNYDDIHQLVLKTRVNIFLKIFFDETSHLSISIITALTRTQSFHFS